MYPRGFGWIHDVYLYYVKKGGSRLHLFISNRKWMRGNQYLRVLESRPKGFIFLGHKREAGYIF